MENNMMALHSYMNKGLRELVGLSIMHKGVRQIYVWSSIRLKSSS